MNPLSAAWSHWAQATQRFRTLLAAPVDGASLAFFRIGFGLVMVWQMVKYLWPSNGISRLQVHYVDVGWNFPYPGFEWVRAWPEPFLTLHFLVVALAGLCVALGFYYRLAAVTLFLSYTYVFLLEATTYNNHYYLMCLVALLLACMPAQACWSVDAWRRSRREGPGALTATPGLVPFWTIFLLRTQLFIMYFYGGIAKINADWLTGIPMLGPGKKIFGFWGEYLTWPDWFGAPEICLFLAWGGLVFDLSIGFLLLFRRTRILAILLTACFHTCNHFLFPIGVFPVLALASTLIFFAPDWPRQLWGWLRRPRLARPDWKWLVGGGMVVPVLGMALGWRSRGAAVPSADRSRLLGWVPAGLICLYVAIQLLAPLRHYFLEGDANWTEQGQRFAWRMMLRVKQADSLLFQVRDPDVQVVDAKGRRQINWERWPAGSPQAVHVAVDSRRFAWSKFPGFSVTYEPLVGPRVIYNPVNMTPARGGIEAARVQIQQNWREWFGREPVVHETVSLAQALRLARQELENEAPTSGLDEARQDAIRQLRDAELLTTQPGPESGEKRLIAVLDKLENVLKSGHGTAVRAHLARTHPFQIQGASSPDLKFLVIDDPQVSLEEVRKLRGGSPCLVWIDMVRLRLQDWSDMPRQFVLFDQKELHICWNYFQELNQVQIDKFTVSPQMIHQYAQRIAGLWQQATGRRPAVHALTNVRLNYREPQPLIDPQADLAACQLEVFGVNDWILPLREGRPRASP